MTETDPATRLRSSCELYLPGDPGYDAARTPWNLSVDLRPAVVAVPRTVEEVADLVGDAGRAGLRVAPLSTGHGVGPLAEQDLDDVVLLRLSELSGVSVDPVARTARVIGATPWRDVVAATAEHGLTALHGSAPDVALPGYVLSGGLSFYARRHGLAAGSVRAVELVTADGELVRADATEHPDLFWALRGGGAANFGVVVAIELDLLPYADVYAGMLLWDRERAPEVLAAWAAWTRTAPETATTVLRVLSLPPLPQLPPFLSGRDLVIIDGAVLEDDEHAASLLAPLRALEPEIDTFGRIPAAELLDVHLDPPGPTPAVSDHTVLGPLDDAALAALLGQVGPGTSSGLTVTEVRHLGGALARPGPAGGALSALPGDYSVFCIATAPTPEAAGPARQAAATVVAALAPWSVPGLVATFTERRVQASRLVDGEDWARLAALRDRYDPARRFVPNHAL
ncbi:FAD-binding oxidoreductase [Nocardioides pantholopis]|uniref:FAD-binding oxidoreductase n=1 Tax=Nocardioides pantholopis TaxID=2483798 RepID=UPI000F08C620|nr:FAD-binding oxidoreductase [Nocardioides pantholopis]